MHAPVLVDEIMDWLPSQARRVVDATVGPGGHARQLLESCPDIQLLALDRDPTMCKKAREALHIFGPRVQVVQGNFSNLTQHLQERGWASVDYIIADLGVSQVHLKDAQRGFSFVKEGPLDMRLDMQGTTAQELLHTLSAKELAKIFFHYGEERMAYKIARALVARRREKPFETTTDLRDFIHRVKGRKKEGRIDSATRVFQALRIAVNRELEHIECFIPQSIHALQSGGRLAIISFHSLEDRIVKNLFRRFSGQCICPPGTPVCRCDPLPLVTIQTRKPIRPTLKEVQANPSARSARLRVVEKR